MKLSISDLDLAGKKVFIRVDFNVPLKNGVIGDDTRIRASLPTIQYALDKGATVILASHLGRPKGGPAPEFSLKPLVARLSELLGRPVVFAEDCVGPKAEAAVAEAHAGGKVALLENLRFHAAEEKNDPVFAGQLASLADLYVNDAFGSAHRAHASVDAVVRAIGEGAAGFLMEKELKYLGDAVENPVRPFVAIIGGAKVSDKIEVIDNLLGKVDALLIGGAMAYTFFKSRGLPVGKSLVEEDRLQSARDVHARLALEAKRLPAARLPRTVLTQHSNRKVIHHMRRCCEELRVLFSMTTGRPPGPLLAHGLLRSRGPGGAFSALTRRCVLRHARRRPE